MSSTSVSLTWTAPEEDGHNGVIRRYNVFLTDLATNAETVVNTIGSGETITLSNLEPFNTYTVRVAAFTTATGPLSTALEFTTLEDGKLVRYSETGYLSVHQSQTLVQYMAVLQRLPAHRAYKIVLVNECCRDLPAGWDIGDR